MKKFLKNQLKNILIKSINRQGASLEKIKKSFPFENLQDKIELLLNEEQDIMKTKLNTKDNKNIFLYSLKDDYINSKKVEKIEKRIYNLDYLCSLFKEVEIINIYKIISDHDKITYQQIANYLNKIYKLKKDIKQVSHYCLILVKINQILSYQPVTVEKFNKSNIVANAYLKSIKENESQFTKTNKENKKIINNNNILKSLTRSLVIDDSEIKNVIMFHLYINKEKEGITANELYVACDFLRREKILNKVISYMENGLSITHKAIRKGKIMEFLYHVLDEGKVSPRIKYLASHFQQIISKHNKEYKFNRNIINKIQPNIISTKSKKKEKNINKIVLDDEDSEEEKEIIENKKISFENINKKDNNINLKEDKSEEENLSKNIKNIPLESEILNQEDYNFILKKMEENKKIIIKENEDKNAMRKNIINYISSIEKNKNVSLSSYNRYIFILNLLYQKKVLSFVEIKHHISRDLEMNKEFVIDRKTIRRLLTTLEKIGLIKIARYELTMRNLAHKYLNSKEEIKQEKIIAVNREVDINDKKFYNKAIEKLKPNKKIEIKKEKIKEIAKIKTIIENKNLNKIINNVIDSNNDKIIINLKTKLSIPIYNVLNKIENKRRIDLKKEYAIFFKRLRQNKITNNYLNNLYSQKNKDNDIINEYKNDDFIENYYKNNNYNFSSLFQEESLKYSNIIIPEYIMNKYNNESQNFFIESSNEKNDKVIFSELEKPIYTIKSKYYNNESNEKKNKFLKEEKRLNKEDNNNKFLIGNKRYRFEKLKVPIASKNEINKEMNLNDIMDYIYNLPGINVKTLRKMLNINHSNFYLEKSMISYMVNIGFLYAQDYDEKNLEINDETKLFPYSNLNLFI